MSALNQFLARLCTRGDGAVAALRRTLTAWKQALHAHGNAIRGRLCTEVASARQIAVTVRQHAGAALSVLCTRVPRRPAPRTLLPQVARTYVVLLVLVMLAARVSLPLPLVHLLGLATRLAHIVLIALVLAPAGRWLATPGRFPLVLHGLRITASAGLLLAGRVQFRAGPGAGAASHHRDGRAGAGRGCLPAHRPDRHTPGTRGPPRSGGRPRRAGRRSSHIGTA